MTLKAEDYSYRSISERESLCSWVSDGMLVPFNHREECAYVPVLRINPPPGEI